MLVANARTALKVGLMKLNVAEGGVILLPDFICDVLLHPMLQLNITPVFYPLSDKLEPEWSALELLAKSNNCDSLVMVHYFGQPQNINKYRAFCEKYDLQLIEDNAHGYGGRLENKLLGTFGDIGIASPRKFLNIPSGGILYVKGGFNGLGSNFKSFPIYTVSALLKIALNLVPPVKRLVQGWLNKNTNWNDPYLYTEKVQQDYGIDKYSVWRINTTNWGNVADQRRRNWCDWERFAKLKGLTTVFQSVHLESCPWAFPVYANNIEERYHWLQWGEKNKIGLFSWPCLPEQIVNENGMAFNRWKVLFCFPLNVSPLDFKI